MTRLLLKGLGLAALAGVLVGAALFLSLWFVLEVPA